MGAAGWGMSCALGLLLLACSPVSAQPGPPRDGGVSSPPPATSGPADWGRFHGIYTGTVGNSRVLVILTVDDDRLQGTYSYERVGKPLSLQGRMTPPCDLTLVESDPAAPSPPGGPGIPTGRFQGSCTPGTLLLKGTWSSPDQKRQLPFSLDQVALLHSESVRAKGNAGSASLEISYPEFRPAVGRLGRFVSEQIAADVRQQIEAFHQDFDAPEESSDLEATVGYQVALFSDTLISLRVVTSNEQTGGRVQRVHTSRLFMMEKEEPREAAAKELFVDPVSKSVARLTALGEQALSKTVPSSEHPRLLPPLRGRQLALTVTSRGLELYYVLPPVDGNPLPLLLPYTNVKEVISRTGVLRAQVR